jgi:hypothetical protein
LGIVLVSITTCLVDRYYIALKRCENMILQLTISPNVQGSCSQCKYIQNVQTHFSLVNGSKMQKEKNRTSQASAPVCMCHDFLTYPCTAVSLPQPPPNGIVKSVYKSRSCSTHGLSSALSSPSSANCAARPRTPPHLLQTAEAAVSLAV